MDANLARGVFLQQHSPERHTLPFSLSRTASSALAPAVGRKCDGARNPLFDSTRAKNMSATFPNQVWPPNQEYLPALGLVSFLLALCALSVFLRERVKSWTTLKNAYFVQWTIIALLVDV